MSVDQPATRAGGGGIATIVLETERSAQLLCRLIGLSAAQDLSLDVVEAQVVADRCRVLLRIETPSEHKAQVLAGKMQQLVGVLSVHFTMYVPAPAN